MTFTMQNLVGDRVLVRGADQFGTEGQAVLDATQWREVNSHKEFDQATEAFDEAVRQFFAPLEQAADNLAAARKGPEQDSIGYVVLAEPVKGQASEPGKLVKLTHDSIVLRLLEQGGHDRLAWVGDDLEVLEAPASQAPAGMAPSAAEVTEMGAEAIGQPVDKS